MKPIVEIQNLKKYYAINAGLLAKHVGDVKAVDGVSFQIMAGETLGLVGESGCGKSTLGRTILRLEEPTAGKVLYDGENIVKWNKGQLKGMRRGMQMIFQDPQSSLDPRMTAGDSIGEALLVHGMSDDKARRESIGELLKSVGLEPEHAERYPHEFSGGQKQRIGIARALAVNPRLIVADEPVSALDVSVQAQILNLLMDLQRDRGLAFLFIAHDLSVIYHVSNRTAVMYLGKIVEIGDKTEIIRHPLHPYTEALLSAVPCADPRKRQKPILLKGEVPSPAAPPPGCRFHTRCPRATPMCKEQEPALIPESPHRSVACHLIK